jgi:hypothetical protein
VWAKDPAVLEQWFLEKPASRIVVNGPTSQGAVGYSTNLRVSFSLGCGPQAGNITSENITARHLLNVKRAAFPRRDWDTLWAKDHARAAALGGERAPRGSGLAGDPALSGQVASVAPKPSEHLGREAQASWSGNLPSAKPVKPPSLPPLPTTSSVAPRPAPRFTEPRASTPPASVATLTPAPRVPAPLPGAVPTPRPAPPAAAFALTPTEIAGILAHAGDGCPMGPCKGCSHHDVQTSSCTALSH